MTENKNAFFNFGENNIASGTNHTSTMIDVKNLEGYFANIGKSLASGSNCSILGETNIPKSINNTIFL